jgi:hypothetical protein
MTDPFARTWSIPLYRAATRSFGRAPAPFAGARSSSARETRPDARPRRLGSVRGGYEHVFA